MLNMTVPPNVCQLPDQGETILTELARRVPLNVSFGVQLARAAIRRALLFAPDGPPKRFTGWRVLRVACEGSLTVRPAFDTGLGSIID